MLKRKIYQTLLDWKNTKRNECLLIKGARQVGKSFIIREFGRKNYQSFIELNFYQHPEYISIFDGDLTPDEIYKRISLQLLGVKFIEGETLIFLDEIQHCPNARTAIKFLAQDNRYDVISSGSLLGLHYKEIVSIPVGYEKQIDMYALDFEEFLWAYGYDGVAIKNLKEYFLSKEKIPHAIHDKFQQIIREYLVVGGMPDVVNVFFETQNFQAVHQKQIDILREYEEDIKKYAKTTDRQKIKDCYYSIPRQLAKEYTKFQYSTVSPRSTAKKYENALEWLDDAGMIRCVYNVSTPQLPLRAYEKQNEFKVYATDIGLTTALFGFETQAALVQDILKGPAKGGIYENLIFDMLIKRGADLHYIKKENSTQEIEFLMEQNCSIIPIEVKSKKGETHSLNEFLKEWNPPYSYKLTSTNIGEVENKITLPHYMAMFI
jgi:predicted AAA+ superfamily ATPase